MSIERNKEAVRRHIDLSWHDGNMDALDEVWASAAIVHLWDGRTLTGLDALKEHLRASVLGFDERMVTVEALIGEGEMVANRWSFRAVDAASGAAVAMRGMDFYRLSEDMIVEEWIEVGL